MEHPEVLPGGRNAKQVTNNNTTNNKISKRSNIMNATRFFKQSLMALISLFLVFAISLGANYKTSNSVTGGGTINVTGNVQNTKTGTAGNVDFGPTVNLNGTGTPAQDITATMPASTISFSTLNVWKSASKTVSIDVTVNTALNFGDGTAGNKFQAGTAPSFTFANGTHQLTIGGTSSYDNTNNNGTIDLSAGTTVYNTTGQTVLNTNLAGTGITYGTLTLSGSNAYTLGASTNTAMAVSTLTATNATLTVASPANISTTGNIGTLTSIAATKLLAYTGSANGTITTANNTTGGELRNSGSGTLTITGLSGNAGVINNTSTGTISFANGATNGVGTIEASAGKLDFVSTLNNGTGNVTITGGTTHNFAGAVTNAGATISVTNATATFNAQFVSNGTLTFGSGSTIAYDGGTTYNIASVTYNNLTIGSLGTKTAASGFTVGGNLALNNVLTMTGTLKLTSTIAANVTGTGYVSGAVQRQHAFTLNTNYAFNDSKVLLGFDATAAGDITLTMTPGVSPTNASTASAEYANRKYAYASAAIPGNLNYVRLGYDQTSELIGGLTETQTGVRYYNGSAWSKVSGAGYTRTSDGVNHYVTVAGTQALAASGELGVFNNVWMAKNATPDIASATNWDEGTVPNNTQDAEVSVTGAKVASAGFNPRTLTISGTGSLAVQDGFDMTVGVGSQTGTSLTIGSTASLSIGAGRTVTVNGDLQQDGALNVAATGVITVQ